MGALIAALVVFLGFSGGGFFPGATALAALVLCVAFVLRITLAARPFEGITAALLAPLALLTAFAVWTLASAAWSDASARALLEFDRVLLYVLALAFFGTLAPGSNRLNWGLRGLAAGSVIVCVSGLVTRVAADVWPIAGNIHDDRLSYPVTYWNAMGLLAAIGLVVCVHLSASEREPPLARVLGTAAVPLLAATLLLTFSRAALLLVPVGILMYVLLARPRGMLGALVAIVPTLATALLFTYRADLIATERFDSPEAISQGHELALVLALCVGAAMLLRALLLPVDGRLARLPPLAVGRRLKIGAAVVILLAMVVGAVALDGPARADRQWDRFVTGNVVDGDHDTRSRLTDAGNNGRIAHWEVALDAFREKPLTGYGAGTYQLLWAENRPYGFTVNDGHSLYLEVLGELGVVGAMLLVGALLTLIVGVARRIGGSGRHAHAAVLAASTVWAIHAGVDWDWEVPMVTLWLFALGGLALGRPVLGGSHLAGSPPPPRMMRVIAALGVLVLAVTPAAIARSQARLDEAVAAFKRDDCAAAIDAALGSIGALQVRPEPYEILGYCNVRYGELGLARHAMRNAVSRDPNSWETHYGLALVRAASGLDPHPRLAIVRRLNPREPLVEEAERLLRGDQPGRWERRAQRARLPIR